MSEADLAKVVVDWLLAEGYEVYQEVSGTHGRCDIVAKLGQMTWAIEAKLHLNLTVIEQALRWVGSANMVSIAIPVPRSRSFGGEVCRRLGIGVLECWASIGGGTVARERRGDFQRRLVTPLRLHEEQKTWSPAGSNRHGYFSPLRATKKALIELITMEPGLTIREAVERIEHHYAHNKSARGTIGRLIDVGEIPELEFREDGRRRRLYLRSQKQESTAEVLVGITS